jgi:hypothetical protein
MRALPGNQLCFPDIHPKRVKHKRNFKCGHCQGLNFVVLISSQSVQNASETSNAGTPRESTLLSSYPFKACETKEKHRMRALPGNQLCCPDVLSKHVKLRRNAKCAFLGNQPCCPDILSKCVKHKRNVKCGHSL